MAKGVPGASRHGTESHYRNHRCRCDDCKVGHAASQRRLRAQRGQMIADGTAPATLNHNEATYTNWLCRCETCKADHAARELVRWRARQAAT